MTDIDEIIKGYSPEFLGGDRQYRDSDGEETTLWRMVRDEPQWTESRFRRMENDICALIAKVREMEKDKAGMVREVQRLVFDNNLLMEESATRTDRAYLNGLKEGWNFGISSDEKGYNAAVDVRQRMITESLNKHEHGGQV